MNTFGQWFFIGLMIYPAIVAVFILFLIAMSPVLNWMLGNGFVWIWS